MAKIAHKVVRRITSRGYILAKIGSISYKEGNTTKSGRYAIFDANNSYRKNILFNSEIITAVEEVNELCIAYKVMVKWKLADDHAFLTETDVQFLVILTIEKYSFYVRALRWISWVMGKMFGGKIIG